MTQLETLRRAILLDPGDDLARLAFADACEEDGNGNLAEFIRIQMELASLGVKRGEESEEQWLLTCRMSVLARDVEMGLPREFGGSRFKERPLDGGELAIEYEASSGANPELLMRRGFVAEIHAPLQTLLDHGGAVAARHPVERVAVVGKEPHSVPANDLRHLSVLRGRWSFYRHRDTPSATDNYCVPTAVWNHMKGYAAKDSVWKSYATEALAKSALGHAVLNRMRAEAGLPELPWKEGV